MGVPPFDSPLKKNDVLKGQNESIPPFCSFLKKLLLPELFQVTLGKNFCFTRLTIPHRFVLTVLVNPISIFQLSPPTWPLE